MATHHTLRSIVSVSAGVALALTASPALAHDRHDEDRTRAHSFHRDRDDRHNDHEWADSDRSDRRRPVHVAQPQPQPQPVPEPAPVPVPVPEPVVQPTVQPTQPDDPQPVVHPSTSTSTVYDQHVLADDPVAYLPLDGEQGDPQGAGPQIRQAAQVEDDGQTGSSKVAIQGGVGTTTMPNGDPAMTFDGRTGFVEIADSDALSIATTGQLTVECWMRPDTLNNTLTEQQGYVHWMGKGSSSLGHEYTLRMYNDGGDRPNRISAYAFNGSGGLGAGSYFQDDIAPGQWIHVAAVFDTRAGTVRIYRDGVLRDTDQLSGYDIHPTNEDAPLRIGTRDGRSFFKGAIGKVAVYDYDASGLIAEHASLM